MIFVTVGTYSFDALIKEVDKLTAQGFFKDEKVLCQIGSGSYEPEHCEFIRYSSSLQKFYEQANFIICHGGTGSTSDCIRYEKSFIAVAHKELADNHQTEFLKGLSEELGFFWAEGPEGIENLYEKAKLKKTYRAITRLFDDLNDYIKS